MKQHHQIVAAINIASGAIHLLIALGFFVFGVILGGFVMSQGEHGIGGFISIFGSAIACFFFLISLPSIIGGWALYAGKSWAKPLLIVLAVLHLPYVPIGTALGVYTLWALLTEDQQPSQLPPAGQPVA